MIIGIDVSRWQPKVDWSVLKAAGVEFVFIKATQGNYMVDTMLKTHVEGANNAGLIVGLYHWCDPTVNAEAQAKYFLNNIQGLNFRMVSADVEQQWADWKEWAQGKVTRLLSPEVISQNAKTILDVWGANLDTTRVVYTRASFIHGYAKPALSWLPSFPLWLAHYPYNSSRITTTWEEFKTKHKPSISSPNLPNGCSKWTFWQFTGDKFVLPGVSTTLDVNYFNGDLNALRTFAGLSTEPETPPPALTVEQRLVRLEALAKAHGWQI